MSGVEKRAIGHRPDQACGTAVPYMQRRGQMTMDCLGGPKDYSRAAEEYRRSRGVIDIIIIKA